MIFVLSLALVLIASVVLSRRLEQVGTWLRLSQSLLGLVAALGSDAPEISSAITALRAGDHDLGLGVVIGSNLFNLASLLGLSALLSGRVTARRSTVWLNGGVALAILGLTMAQLFGVLPAGWTLALIGLVMVPYVVLLAVSPLTVLGWAQRLGIGRGLSLDAEDTKSDADLDATRAETPPRPSYQDMLGTIPALVAIVLGSIGMVHMAILLGGRWKVPGAVTGTLILAVLTGIPNIVTAVGLAMKGRGSAVVSESLNSNTFNLIAGAALPALLLGTAPVSGAVAMTLWLLLGMTLLALGWALVRGGLNRWAGGVLVAVYLAFAAAVLLHG